MQAYGTARSAITSQLDSSQNDNLRRANFEVGIGVTCVVASAVTFVGALAGIIFSHSASEAVIPFCLIPVSALVGMAGSHIASSGDDSASFERTKHRGKLDFLDATMKEVLAQIPTVGRGDVAGPAHLGAAKPAANT